LRNGEEAYIVLPQIKLEFSKVSVSSIIIKKWRKPMKERRRKYSPSQKAGIVRELLEGGYTVSEISEKYEIHPAQIIRWKKELFEGAAEIFDRKLARSEHRHEREVEILKSKVAHKDGIIAELLEENMELKKNDGVY
jgi:transposase